MKRRLPLIVSVAVVFALLVSIAASGNSLHAASPLTSVLVRNGLAQPLTLTYNYFAYLPIIGNRMGLRGPVGAEMDGGFTDGNGMQFFEKSHYTITRYAGVQWEQIEATKGTYNWDATTDSSLIRAHNDGADTLLIIRGVPTWARPVTDTTKLCGPIDASHYADFANFVDAVVARYLPYTQFFELGNEPDVDPYYIGLPNGLPNDGTIGCWGNPNDTSWGGAGAYVNMLKVVTPQVKADHPTAKFLNGGLLFGNNPDTCTGDNVAKFAKGLITLGSLDYLDGFSYHGYTYWNYTPNGTFLEKQKPSGCGWNASPTIPKIQTITSWLKATINQYAPAHNGIPLYLTENAMVSYQAYVMPPSDQLRVVQSYYAAISTGFAVYHNLSGIIYWRMEPSQMYHFNTELLDNSGSVLYPNKVYTALLTSNGNMVGYPVIGWDSNQSQAGVSILKFDRGTLGQLWLVWNSNGDNAVPLTYTLSVTPTAMWDVWNNPLPPTKSIYLNDPYRALYIKP